MRGAPRPGSAVPGQFQRHLAPPPPGCFPRPHLPEGASRHTPPAQRAAYPTQLSAAPAPFFPLRVHQRPGANPGLGRGKLLEGRVGTNTSVFQGGRGGNSPNEMHPPPGRGGSQGGGAGPRAEAASLPSASQLPIVRTLQGPGTSPRERRLGEALRAATCHSSPHRARRALGACEGTRARTRTRTHTLGSLDHALLALRPSALPPVKTRRSTLPSLRALGRKQALQLTSDLANNNNNNK